MSPLRSTSLPTGLVGLPLLPWRTLPIDFAEVNVLEKWKRFFHEGLSRREKETLTLLPPYGVRYVTCMVRTDLIHYVTIKIMGHNSEFNYLFLSY